MPDDADITRWTVSVSRDTDTAVRSFLAQHGIEEDGLSRFIEDAVKWRVLDQTLAEARAGFADLSSDEIEALADEAVASVRQARRETGLKASSEEG